MAPHSITVEQLGTLPFFKDLPRPLLEPLLERHRLVGMPAGQTLVMEADWDDAILVLLDGIAKVRSFAGDGDETVLALLGAGDLLGEISILDGHSRSADVYSLTPVQLLKLQGHIFRRYLTSEIDLALSIARLEAERLREMNQRFALQRSDATSKILYTLAYLAVKSSPDANPLALIPALSQGEIAIIAGLSRETSSRVISKLRSKDIVREVRGCLRLASLEPLLQRSIWS